MKSVIFDLIKASIWNESFQSDADQATFEEIKNHAIFMLPATILSNISMPAELRQEWELLICQCIENNARCEHMQSILPLSVPYVILKGTSAAKYYPEPDNRVLGDIDIITKPEDHQVACNELISAGYTENTSPSEEKKGRHRSFSKDNTIIEMHAFFSELNDPSQAQFFDNLVFENINPSHVLPDLVNGLVLLEHISQHMDNGIGLRQIIDWMMFVDKCLPDEQWPEFSMLAQKIGLNNLAIVTTRMCELYLGLPHREWCSEADKALCAQLMDYVLSCGNFGNKKTEDAEISKSVLAYLSKPVSFCRLLQRQGMVNWEVAQRYRYLRPFAWIYQAFRYAFRGLGRDKAISKIRVEYAEAQNRTAMFDALGVKTGAKGFLVLKDGKYVRYHG